MRFICEVCDQDDFETEYDVQNHALTVHNRNVRVIPRQTKKDEQMNKLNEGNARKRETGEQSLNPLSGLYGVEYEKRQQIICTEKDRILKARAEIEDAEANLREVRVISAGIQLTQFVDEFVAHAMDIIPDRTSNPLRKITLEVECGLVRLAMHKCGLKSKAMIMLGISRNTLSKRLKGEF